mmetsp:Transcript_25043/g.51875  ORF Transcript_25043/g.51875 Transcript_25043/m.51875 type:complete len:519 (+) Transcript_25043:110-1666(+)
MRSDQPFKQQMRRSVLICAAIATLLSNESSVSLTEAFQRAPTTFPITRTSHFTATITNDATIPATRKYSRLFESTSVASNWMEAEKKIEEEMDAAMNEATNSDDNGDDDGATIVQPGRWEALHGNYILRPPNNSQPRALLHFLGGALLGAAPDLTYRYLLERLSTKGYLIVATPYQLSFDHLQTCDEIIDKFERVAPGLAKTYGAVPVVGVGHSCGALLHMLITSLFPDTPRAANALISYNNRPVGDAVPLFEEVFVPLFSNRAINGSELLKSLIKVAREKYNGKVPSDDAILELLKSIPTPISELAPANLNIPQPLRDSLTAILAEPTFNTLNNAGITPLLLQSLDISAQIPKLIDEVADGARDFVPTPDAMSSAARRAYRCRRTLLLQFIDDTLDDSEFLEGYLKEAESVMKMKRPMITIDLKRKVLEGNHLTPLWGPVGGEEWGKAIEEALGGFFGGSGGSAAATTADEGATDGEEVGVMNGSSESAKAVRQRLGYAEVEKVVEELVCWLDEGSL